ncbi:MAG: polyphosphate:AMP phosphotransferase [Betaproteobacteria bacterium]
MFDSANLSHKVDKTVFKREAPKLREALLNVQFELKEANRFPVLVLIAGVEGAGKGETVNLLNAWMDPRHISTYGFPEPTAEEGEYPRMWRFWRALPPKGKIGVFFGAWHTQPIVDRVTGRITAAELDQHIGEILRFEQMLGNEGMLLLKFWFHLSEKQQKSRLRTLEKDPDTSWRVTKKDWELFSMYDKFYKVSESFLRRTSTGEAPWMVVPGMDARYRTLKFGKTLLAALRERLDEKPGKPNAQAAPLLPVIDKVNVLRALDLNQHTTEAQFDKQLEKWQGKLAVLARSAKFKRTAVVAVFEGNDAAGKGGAIRRITGALDARQYHNIPIAAPTDEERAQPYLWRFWRHIPRRGRFAIFDRSWYGRVLVERVEGFCTEADWMRAYTEINDFEQQLVKQNIIVVKFWLAISKAEQHKRFKAREITEFKRFKITEEDWRNRKKWDAYELAVCDMVDRCSSSSAPWTLVEANNKYFARIKVLKTLCAAIERALDDMPGEKKK